MAAKKPLTFSLDDQSPAPLRVAPSVSTKSRAQETDSVERKQVGARIPMSLYRKLKAHAALKGETVQITLEAAVTDYLNRHAESV